MHKTFTFKSYNDDWQNYFTAIGILFFKWAIFGLFFISFLKIKMHISAGFQI